VYRRAFLPFCLNAAKGGDKPVKMQSQEKFLRKGFSFYENIKKAVTERRPRPSALMQPETVTSP